MQIKVDKAVIDNGVRKDSKHCMLADAVKAAIPKAQFIHADLQTIRYSDLRTGKRYTFLTPSVAQHNLLKYDRGDAVTPFVFPLNNPVRTRDMGWGSKATRPDRVKARRGTHKQTAAYRKKYAYLAKNREMGRVKEREFGLRKYVE